MIRTLLLVFLLLSPGSAFAQSAPVHVLTFKGAVGPANANYVDRGLEQARQEEAQLVVIKMDTPGGLLTTTREMVQNILAAPVPVAIYVSPPGAQAASAGTFLSYAAHVAAMAPGTNLGAATPIEMRGQLKTPGQKPPEGNSEDQADAPGNEKAMRQKAVNDAVAFIRGLADLRGRNADWAEKAVREGASLTADKALEHNVVDVVAKNLPALLDKIDGHEITLQNGRKVTLTTRNAPIIDRPPDWRVRFLSTITDPNVAFILMTIGTYGLIYELANPGAMIPGVIGLIALMVGLFAMNVLPVNFAGLGLIFAGLAFMVGEAFIPSFGILGIGGAVAFVLGATMLFDGSAMPGLSLDWQVIAAMTVLSATMLSVVLTMVTHSFRARVTTGEKAMLGETGEVIEWDGPEGKIWLNGERWNAVSAAGPLDLTAGDKVVIDEVDGLTLKVRVSA